jgi:putative ABC transport system ATP-binding protein
MPFGTSTDMEDRMSLYELRGVTKTFSQGSYRINAVADVDLDIREHEFVVIAGPSGSGKTTLLQLLGALDRPSEGRVSFEGRDLASLGDAELARLRLEAFGFVFQQFNLIPTLTAAQNVEVALAPRRLTAKRRHEEAGRLLASVGLGPRAAHLPSQLSGGEQQRVAIARALANEPRVLLADEPTGNLDSETGNEIVSLLRSLSTDQGQTVVLITHDQAIAAGAPRVVRMRDGRVVEPAATAAPTPVPAGHT